MLSSDFGDTEFETIYSVTVTGVPIHTFNNFPET
jgi:hypothetical protein